MIELDDNSYIIGVWFSSNPVTGNNWLAAVVRDPENPQKYKGWSRFRYIRDTKVFDSDDEKSWTTFYSQEGQTEDDMIDFMDKAQIEIEQGYPDKDKIIVLGSLKELMELSKDKEWMFMKTKKAN